MVFTSGTLIHTAHTCVYQVDKEALLMEILYCSIKVHLDYGNKIITFIRLEYVESFKTLHTLDNHCDDI